MIIFSDIHVPIFFFIHLPQPKENETRFNGSNGNGLSGINKGTIAK